MFSKSNFIVLFVSLIFSSVSYSSSDRQLLGETIDDLFNSKEMNVINFGKVLVKPKIDFFIKPRGKTNCFTKTMLKHKVSKKIFYSYHTTEDKCDGGNSIGWIENKVGDVIAEISDSFIYEPQLSYKDIKWNVEVGGGDKDKVEKSTLQLIKKHIFSKRSLWSSLYGYTLVSLEGNGIEEDLSEKNILKIMLKYLKKSTIKILEETEGFHIKNKKLFVLKYNMDGFVAFAYFTVDNKLGNVEFIQIDD